MKETKKKGRIPREPGALEPRDMAFTRKNYILLAAGLALITAGYLLLARGSITLAPILLILGYCVIIPIAIVIR
ncbi:MAG: hypothetical protein A2Z06_00675 [Candidatus Glassbacteria bacterium RBG_16_58_8]|uniref:DUF3098 domain-containing protein n=1 Tax=Candidatus Glassbacteria bacterium RBG_16_58_8 TaxID=1817866 RepID=A0A1F5YCF3_9BACT|nr:MAG: hypothetical protein A2Z06_00675 [Candidatus Glassbacteria bacterium RBG_16_58_8]